MSANAITVTRGSCLSVELLFQSEDGTPEDISEDDLSIFDANRPAFLHAVISKADPANGKAELFLAAEYVSQLGLGRTNRFRLSRKFPDGCYDNSSVIEVIVI